METSRYVIWPSPLRRTAPIADGLALPWTMFLSAPTDCRRTYQIRGAAPRFNDGRNSNSSRRCLSPPVKIQFSWLTETLA